MEFMMNQIIFKIIYQILKVALAVLLLIKDLVKELVLESNMTGIIENKIIIMLYMVVMGKIN
jgi:hypothetical protein